MKYNRFIKKVTQEKGQPYKILQRNVQHRIRWFGIHSNMRKRWIASALDRFQIYSKTLHCVAQ